ncbi:hypothetical protein FHG87_014539 [Trinorchestia longiramus]|nr:hypothetical protein FHG87_014539 [Trinorchestia longiramus]
MSELLGSDAIERQTDSRWVRAPRQTISAEKQAGSSIFNVPASCLPSPKPASPPAKVEDQQLRYFLQKDKITSFDAFKSERNLQKQYKNLIISRSKERPVCLFMTDNFKTFWCCHANASCSSSIDKDQVLRETFDKVQTLQQKNVFLLVDEVQIRPTVSISWVAEWHGREQPRLQGHFYSNH